MALNATRREPPEQTAYRGVRRIDYVPQILNNQPARFYLMWMLLPAVLLLAAISLYPFAWLIYMSLHEVQLAPGKSDLWVGVDNFTRLFTDKNFARGWVTLFKYSALCLTVEITLGVLVAIILNNSRLEKLFITIFLMPMMMAPVVAGFLYMFLYNGTFGWYFWLLRSLGVLDGGTILGNKTWALAGVVATDVWQWTPLIALITLAGLKRVPQEQLEANMVDGAGPLRNFFSVALPNLYPFLLIAILLRFMDNFMEHLRTLRRKRREVIICADWNICHQNIDLKNWRSNRKNSGFLPEERAWLDMLYDEVGYVDSFRLVNSEEEQYTWWSNRGQSWAKNVGWRLDYQVITPKLATSVKSADIYKEQRFSDHAPQIMEYDLEITV